MFGLDFEVNADLLLGRLLKVKDLFGGALNNLSEVDLEVGVITGVRVQRQSESSFNIIFISDEGTMHRVIDFCGELH